MAYENLYRDAFENASSGKAIITLDGRWFKVNKVLSLITGYEQEELLDHPFEILSHPDDENKTKFLFREPSEITDKLIIDQRLVHKNGKILWVSLHIILLKSGENSYYHVDVYDIGLKLEKEKELNALSHMHQLILDSISEGILGIDCSGNTVFLNKASEKMLGYNQQALTGKNVQEAIGYKNRDTENCPLKEAIARQKPVHVNDDLFWRKDGSSFEVEYSINPINEKSQFKGLVLIFRDVTELKKSQEFIQRSEKLSLVGQMAAGIAHEIRNPLTSLKGFLQLIQSGETDKESYYTIMAQEFTRIEIILNELLLLAKPQAKQLETYDLNLILKQVINILEPQCLIENVQIHSKLEQAPLYIDCDENEIKQVFINLIKNGIDAMSGGGELIIHSKKKDDHAVVEVIDQGIGIPKEKLEKLGQPFFTTKEKGTGLGLMVTFGIIENIGGHVVVESELNKGTTFQVKVPIKM